MYFFSSTYSINAKGEKIGSQLMSQFAFDGEDEQYAWLKPCPTLSLMGYIDEANAISTLNPGDGVADITQEDFWSSFTFDSKSVPQVYLDNYFFKNPSDLIT